MKTYSSEVRVTFLQTILTSMLYVYKIDYMMHIMKLTVKETVVYIAIGTS